MAWMAPTYGHPDYIVRDIYRSETGWWDRNITHLHPAPAPEAAEAIRTAIADPRHVLETVEALRGRGERQLALHVLDLLALCPGDDPEVIEARAIKAAIAEELADAASSFISANLYRTMADYPHRRATE
jgi:alkyl sulfatase BDS1-like metallo-beta-lactamase superfamily hydrolase